MTIQTTYYSLPANIKLKTWANRITALARSRLKCEHEISVEKNYLDSFDWLFHNAGIQLLTEQHSGPGIKKINLHWLSHENNISRPPVITFSELPRTAADFPAGKMRDRIEAILDIRALIPVAQILSNQIHLTVVDKQNKTRARLILENNHVKPGSRRKSVDLGYRLYVQPLTGYEKDYVWTLKLLEKVKELKVVEDDLFDKAVTACGRRPGDYSSKIRINLEREWRVDKACRTVLLGQLAQIEQNIEGTIADIDTEFLHDFRVAVRRSRSLLSRMKAAFPETIQQRFSKELAWLGSITTPQRDMDVYMLDFPKYRHSLPAKQRADLDPFYDFLREHHESEQQILITHLNSRRFNNFRISWRKYLEKPLPKTSRATLALQPIGNVADNRIWKTYRRLIKEGSVITSHSPDDAIHELRKTCKKLRYLLEFFSSLYPRKEVKAIIKALKGFQENLGDFQDLSVQAEKLQRFNREMIEEGITQPKTMQAMQSLVDNMRAKKKVVRAEFAERFNNFASKEIEQDFRVMCSKGKTPKKKDAKKEKKAKRDKTPEAIM